MRKAVPLLCACALGLAMACGGKAKAAPAAISADPNLAPSFRLSDASVPKAYHLRLAIDPDKSDFSGKISIDVELGHTLHTFWLHQKDLDISDASFHRNGRTIPLTRVSSKDDPELLGLTATEELFAGLGRIEIRFAGKLGSREALFRQKQEERWYAYSDFEATDARAAFPCYDEPRFNVPWQVEIEAPSGALAFSNAPEVAREEQEGGSWLFRFATTRPLPSYLVAMAVGPFDLIEGKASNTPLRIIAPKGQARLGRFLLENTGQWIQYLESYLDMAMPFPKLDFIAVPQFSGAMENPGLVTFSSNILLNPRGTSQEKLTRAAGVAAHELAHMWFGNLLTPRDWQDLWLNEAFATWLSDKVIQDWQPSKAREILDIADKSTAFEIDHRLGGRMVRQPIENREDIRQAFDAITYRKGGALLTMLEAWLGEGRMRQAVRKYLHSSDGTSVSAKDLVVAMHSAAPKKQVEPILKSFLEQPGIPTLRIRLQCDDKPQVEITQERYLPLSVQARAQSEERSAIWHVPLCLRYPTGGGLTRECTILHQKKSVLALRGSSCPAWLLPNDRETGYYHYLLSGEGFASLSNAQLDPREQQGLVHNLIAAVESGELDVGPALDMLEVFATTGPMHVQQAVIPLLYLLERSVVGPRERAGFSQRIRSWYQARLKAMGLASKSSDSREDRILRPVFIHLLSELGDDEDLAAQAKSIADAWLESPQRTDLQLLDSILQAAAHSGDAELAKRYSEGLKNPKDRAAAPLLLGALHAFSDPALFATALDRSVPDYFGLPNLEYLLVRALASPTLRPLLLSKLTTEREAILHADSKSDPAVRKERFALVAGLLSELCDAEGVIAVRRFAGEEFDPQPIIDSIEGCMAFAAGQRASSQAAFAPKAK